MKVLQILFYGLLFFLAFFVAPEGMASPTDSLRQEYSTEKKPERRYYIARQLVVRYAAQHLDSAMRYARYTLSAAKESGVDSLCADAFHVLSAIQVHTGNYDSSLYYSEASTRIWHDMKKDSRLASNYNVMASTYSLQGKIEKAYEYYFKALRAFEATKDTAGQRNVLNNLGGLALQRDMAKEAEEFYVKGLSLATEPVDSLSLLLNLANTHLGESENQKAIGYIRSGIRISKALELSTQLGLFYKYYANYLARSDELDSAFWYIEKSITLVRQSKSLRHTYTTLLRGASIGLETKQLVAVKDYLDEAWTLYHKGAVGYEEVYSLHDYYGKFYEQLNMPDSALHHYKSLIAVKDSIFRLDQTTAAEKMRAQFDAEKKEKEIALLNKDKALQDAEIERQRWMLGLGVGVLVLILALLFLVYRNNLQRKKAQELLARQKAQVEETAVSLREANVEVNQQKEEILAINEALEAQKEELAAHNKHQTDAIRYASTIQQAVLPWEERLNKSLAEYFILSTSPKIFVTSF